MTSGRKRKERRRARQAKAGRDVTSSPGESGAGEIASSGMPARDEVRLVKRAVDERWCKARWPTRDGIKQIAADIEKRGDATPIEKTMLTVVKLLDGDARANGIAARTVVTMEAQNQADEHFAEHFERGRKEPDPLPINLTVTLSVQAAIERVKLLPRSERAKLLEAARMMRELRTTGEP